MKFNMSELLYISSLILIGFAYGFFYDSGKISFNILAIIAGMLLLAKIVVSSYKQKNFGIIMLVSIIVVLTGLTTKKITLLITYMLFVGIKGVDLKKAMKAFFATNLVCFSTTILMAVIGIKEDFVDYQYRLSVGDIIVRHSLGYPNENMMQQAYFILVVIYVFIKYENMKIYKLVIILSMNQILFSYSRSRTSYLATILLIIFFVLNKCKSRCVDKFVKATYILTPIILMVMSFYLICTYGTPLTLKLNDLFQTRLYIAKCQFDYYGINLFGISKATLGSCDMGYVNLLLIYGILVYTIFMLLFLGVNIELLKEDKKKEMLIVFIIFVSGFAEAVFMVIAKNPATLIVADYVMNRYRYNEVERYLNEKFGIHYSSCV